MPVAELTTGDREQMLALMQRHYASVNPEVFAADLLEKQWIIQVRDAATNTLRGFSTQMELEVPVEQQSVRALFSGDTIIDQEYWGDPTLIRLGGELALSLAKRDPHRELYWFLISQGYKTYRFLPVFFHEFYPRHDRPTPPAAAAIIDALATAKYLSRYESARGVIRANQNQYHLREGVADATDQRLRDPHVQYFVERNPGHLHGDELCCIAPISLANFTPAAHRVLCSDSAFRMS